MRGGGLGGMGWALGVPPALFLLGFFVAPLAYLFYVSLHAASASELYARLLAITVRQRFSATWGLAETGAAGPTGNRYGDAAGHSCIALVSLSSERAVTLETGSANRQANMRTFAKRALELFEEVLKTA